MFGRRLEGVLKDAGLKRREVSRSM